MKIHLVLLFCFWGISNICLAQSSGSPSKQIKVYLIGTFHFAQTDSSYNVLDSKNQQSIENLSETMTSAKPDKIFVERQPEYEYQNRIDSLYTVYQQKNLLPGRNEIYQLGFRAAKKLGHKKVYQCDHPSQYGRFYRAAMEYAEKANQMAILEGAARGTIKRQDDIVNEDSIMRNSTLFDYVKWINSDLVMSTSHASYIANYPQIGSTDYYNSDDEETLIGAELLADWYKRNIMIYSKIINQLDYNENAILVLIGSDHAPILASLFSANPYFEVVNTSTWLK